LVRKDQLDHKVLKDRKATLLQFLVLKVHKVSLVLKDHRV
jgi:hypothetical protein